MLDKIALLRESHFTAEQQTALLLHFRQFLVDPVPLLSSPDLSARAQFAKFVRQLALLTRVLDRADEHPMASTAAVFEGIVSEEDLAKLQERGAASLAEINGRLKKQFDSVTRKLGSQRRLLSINGDDAFDTNHADYNTAACESLIADMLVAIGAIMNDHALVYQHTITGHGGVRRAKIVHLSHRTRIIKRINRAIQLYNYLLNTARELGIPQYASGAPFNDSSCQLSF